MLRGRFAPSPTGELHLGSLRTALAAWLSSRGAGGEFVVRLEDLDRVTSSRKIAEGQLRDLQAIGIDWDGEPVFQSDRFDLYEEVLEGLRANGLAYECFCTRKEIREAAVAPHGKPLRYAGTCRQLTAAQRQERRTQRPGAIRLSVQDAGIGEITFIDRYRGLVCAQPDDIVLRRNDGVPAYNLAVVVDDALQGITEVLRGDDLLEVTVSQIALQRLLGYQTPQYAHVPLMLGDDGERLAKRHGPVGLRDLSQEGVSASDIRARLEAEVRSWRPYGKS